jgi:hypothetical protein
MAGTLSAPYKKPLYIIKFYIFLDGYGMDDADGGGKREGLYFFPERTKTSGLDLYNLSVLPQTIADKAAYGFLKLAAVPGIPEFQSPVQASFLFRTDGAPCFHQ